MRAHAQLFVVLLFLYIATASEAAVVPQPSQTDARIRIVHYDPNQVIEFRGALGYQTSIEFGEDERIENISIGDSLAWQVTPNRRANLLFIKPLRRDATTNMAVFTNLRRYMFDLSVRPQAPTPHDRNIIFGLRFDYPEPAPAMVATSDQTPAVPALSRDSNTAYTYEGSSVNLPARVFDDGQSTYFTFPATSDYPAIFALDDKGKEAIVNVSQRDGYVVVDQIAPGFVLRHGDDVTRIINDGYRKAQPGPDSPKPRKHSKGPLGWLF